MAYSVDTKKDKAHVQPTYRNSPFFLFPGVDFLLLSVPFVAIDFASGHRMYSARIRAPFGCWGIRLAFPKNRYGVASYRARPSSSSTYRRHVVNFQTPSLFRATRRPLVRELAFLLHIWRCVLWDNAVWIR